MMKTAVHNDVGSLKEQAKKWSKRVDAESVDKLNKLVRDGNGVDLILVCEAMQQNSIYEIAKNIRREKKKIVLIAGPSSAGKTTFSHRLKIQLKALGLKPHAIAMDNYFVNRQDNPKDENGNYDFECVEALDVKLFNDDMNKLLAGEETELPHFDFFTGQRLYKGDMLKIGEKDVLIIEGIHSLNPYITYNLCDDDKYKIYISPLNQLAIDEDSKISTMDGRLIRRIVRDCRTRGHSIDKTLGMWSSVRSGEEKYIFPYENQADAMFNSGLLYEYSVMRKYAEPLIETVQKDSPYYEDAERLMNFISRFEPLSDEAIPMDSILREFIGGGICELIN